MIGDSPESAAAAAVAAANTGDVEVAVDAVLTAAGSPVQQASVKAARMKSKTARRLSNAQQVRISKYMSYPCLYNSRIVYSINNKFNSGLSKKRLKSK